MNNSLFTCNPESIDKRTRKKKNLVHWAIHLILSSNQLVAIKQPTRTLLLLTLVVNGPTRTRFSRLANDEFNDRNEWECMQGYNWSTTCMCVCVCLLLFFSLSFLFSLLSFYRGGRQLRAWDGRASDERKIKFFLVC